MQAFYFGEERQIDEFEIKCICKTCPERYFVYDMDRNKIGDIRLHHGIFGVKYPNCDGELLLEAFPRGDGFFYNEEERETYIMLALDAIRNRMMKEVAE